MAAFDCEVNVRRVLWVAAIAPALLCPSDPALAQSGPAADPQGAVLRGTVVDTAGAVIKGAEVVVFRDGTTVAHRRTDAQGDFTFSGPSREYRVSVHASGFGELRSAPVPFAVGSTTRFTLEAAQPGGNEGSPVAPPETAGRSAFIPRQLSWEYGVLAQGGVGTEDRSNYKFFLLGGHLGRVLTPNLGSGLLQGNFEYAVEVFPFWQSYTPRFQKISCTADPPAPVGSYTCSEPYTVGGTYTGVSVTPIMLRWNFTHGERWMPWIQGAGGVVWTDHKYPAVGNLNPLDTASNGPHGDTSVWNFTPQFGIGTHYFLRPRQSLDFSANAVHISSSSLGDKNPGVNATVQFSVGYTWWK